MNNFFFKHLSGFNINMDDEYHGYSRRSCLFQTLIWCHDIVKWCFFFLAVPVPSEHLNLNKCFCFILNKCLCLYLNRLFVLCSWQSHCNWAAILSHSPTLINKDGFWVTLFIIIHGSDTNLVVLFGWGNSANFFPFLLGKIPSIKAPWWTISVTGKFSGGISKGNCWDP